MRIRDEEGEIKIKHGLKEGFAMMMMGNELEKYDQLNLLQLTEKNSMQLTLLRRKSHTEQD